MNHQQNLLMRGIQAENRQLREVIEKMKQEQAQGVFIEQLQAHAIGGLCSQPWILSSDMSVHTGREEDKGKTGIQIAIETSNTITNGVIEQIMKAVREAQRAEEEAKQTAKSEDEAEPAPEELPPTDRVHPPLTLDTTMPPPEERIDEKPLKKRDKKKSK